MVHDGITRRFPFLGQIVTDASFQRPQVVWIITRSDTGFGVQPKPRVIERAFAWVCINPRLDCDVERAVEEVRALFRTTMIKQTTRRILHYRDRGASLSYRSKGGKKLEPRGEMALTDQGEP